MKFSVSTIFLLLILCSYAQESEDSFTLRGVVIDSLSNEQLPFVSIYKKRDRKGTRSGFDGTYALENVQSGDTIFCSNIGYEKHFFIAKKKHPLIK